MPALVAATPRWALRSEDPKAMTIEIIDRRLTTWNRYPGCCAPGWRLTGTHCNVQSAHEDCGGHQHIPVTEGFPLRRAGGEDAGDDRGRPRRHQGKPGEELAATAFTTAKVRRARDAGRRGVKRHRINGTCNLLEHASEPGGCLVTYPSTIAQKTTASLRSTTGYRLHLSGVGGGGRTCAGRSIKPKAKRR